MNERAVVWTRAIFAEEEHVRLARSSEAPLAQVATELAAAVSPSGGAS